MVRKPKSNMILLPSGGIGVKETVKHTKETLDTKVNDPKDLEALELLVIKDNLQNYPDIFFLPDLFEAIKIPQSEQTDFKLATLMRTILKYDEEKKDEVIVEKEKMSDLYVEIPTEGLYAKFNFEDRDFSLVYQLAFLKAEKYVPVKSDGMKIIPCLGEKVKRTDFRGRGLVPPYLVTTEAIKSHKNIDELKKFLILEGITTEPFVCGDYIYSITQGILGQHGILTSKNIEVLKKKIIK